MHSPTEVDITFLFTFGFIKIRKTQFSPIITYLLYFIFIHVELETINQN
jgi:hypothetical protein